MHARVYRYKVYTAAGGETFSRFAASFSRSDAQRRKSESVNRQDKLCQRRSVPRALRFHANIYSTSPVFSCDGRGGEGYFCCLAKRVSDKFATCENGCGGVIWLNKFLSS